MTSKLVSQTFSTIKDRTPLKFTVKSGPSRSPFRWYNLPWKLKLGCKSNTYFRMSSRSKIHLLKAINHLSNKNKQRSKDLFKPNKSKRTPLATLGALPMTLRTGRTLDITVRDKMIRTCISLEKGKQIRGTSKSNLICLLYRLFLQLQSSPITGA